jgi:hypothetical protein
MPRSSFTLLLLSLCCLKATAADTALARIVAVEKSNAVLSVVTLKVESGAFYNNTDVEVLAPSHKMAATMLLPDGIDMLLMGDEVKGVKVVPKEAKPVAGFIADPGKFASHAAAQQALAAPAKPPAAAKPATPPAPAAEPDKTKGCPYTDAELGAALGMKLIAGQGDKMPFPGGVSLSCTYSEVGGFGVVYVNQIVMPHDKLWAGEKEFSKRLAGKVEYIRGDPDLARWQSGQGDLTGVVLHYIRDGVQVEVRVMPGASFMKDPKKVEDMKARVLKLRRLP